MHVTGNDTKQEYISWKFIIASLSYAISRFQSLTADVRSDHLRETGTERPAWLLTR